MIFKKLKKIVKGKGYIHTRQRRLYNIPTGRRYYNDERLADNLREAGNAGLRSFSLYDQFFLLWSIKKGVSRWRRFERMYLCRASLLYKTLFSLLQGHLKTNKKKHIYIYIYILYIHTSSLESGNRRPQLSFDYLLISSLCLSRCVPTYNIFLPCIVYTKFELSDSRRIDPYIPHQNRYAIAYSCWGRWSSFSNSSVQKKKKKKWYSAGKWKEQKNERNYIYSANRKIQTIYLKSITPIVFIIKNKRKKQKYAEICKFYLNNRQVNGQLYETRSRWKERNPYIPWRNAKIVTHY